MKKICILLFLFVFAIFGNLIAREKQTFSNDQGLEWEVMVTYNIYYSYYENKDGSGTVAEGVYQKSESVSFDVYAETADEAESRAKEECATVCSNMFGRYVGLRTYKGKSYHAFESRKVAQARAKVKKK